MGSSIEIQQLTIAIIRDSMLKISWAFDTKPGLHISYELQQLFFFPIRYGNA
jgi:hypothetical protein